MPKFWVAIHHPHDYDAVLQEDAAMGQAIDELNNEMVAAGIRVFVGGLFHGREAVSLSKEGTEQSGSYLGASEHVAGFWVLDLPDLDSAKAWGRKAVDACRAPVEVRQFFG